MRFYGEIGRKGTLKKFVITIYKTKKKIYNKGKTKKNKIKPKEKQKFTGGKDMYKTDFEIKKEICEIGRRIYQDGFVAANDGNISVRWTKTLISQHRQEYQRAL